MFALLLLLLFYRLRFGVFGFFFDLFVVLAFLLFAVLAIFLFWCILRPLLFIFFFVFLLARLLIFLITLVLDLSFIFIFIFFAIRHLVLPLFRTALLLFFFL